MLLRMTLFAAIDDCRVRPDGLFPFYTRVQVKKDSKAMKEGPTVWANLYILDHFFFFQEKKELRWSTGACQAHKFIEIIIIKHSIRTDVRVIVPQSKLNEPRLKELHFQSSFIEHNGQ